MPLLAGFHSSLDNVRESLKGLWASGGFGPPSPLSPFSGRCPRPRLVEAPSTSAGCVPDQEGMLQLLVITMTGVVWRDLGPRYVLVPQDYYPPLTSSSGAQADRV